MKNKIIMFTATAVLFLIYSLAVFNCGIVKQDVFWLDYYFTAFAFLIFEALIISAEGQKSIKKFLTEKTVLAGSVYVLIQLVCGILFIDYPNSNVFQPCLTQIIIIGVFSISLLLIKKLTK